jgi:DNA-binding transcriptional MerR regulator
MTVPEKKYYRIGEVSKLTDVEPHIIRYWESEFSQIKPHRIAGQRLFRDEDVDIIKTIKRLLHVYGLTIAGAKRFMAENESSSLFAKDMHKDIIKEVKKELIEIRKKLKP